MDCPVCLKEMAEQVFFEVESNICQFCGGVWLDAGELADFIKKGTVPQRLMANYCIDESLKKVEEGHRNCPRCRNLLQLIVHKGINIDFCYRCRGVWFDKGELKQLLLEYYKQNDKQARTRKKRPAQEIQIIKGESGNDEDDIIRIFDDEIMEDVEEPEPVKQEPVTIAPGALNIEQELLGDASVEDIADSLPKNLREKKDVNFSLGMSPPAETNLTFGSGGLTWGGGKGFSLAGGKRKNILVDALADFVCSLFIGQSKW
jgi:Zn-finger nucleic acid-binding protein